MVKRSIHHNDVLLLLLPYIWINRNRTPAVIKFVQMRMCYVAGKTEGTGNRLGRFGRRGAHTVDGRWGVERRVQPGDRD